MDKFSLSLLLVIALLASMFCIQGCGPRQDQYGYKYLGGRMVSKTTFPNLGVGRAELDTIGVDSANIYARTSFYLADDFYMWKSAESTLVSHWEKTRAEK